MRDFGITVWFSTSIDKFYLDHMENLKEFFLSFFKNLNKNDSPRETVLKPFKTIVSLGPSSIIYTVLFSVLSTLLHCYIVCTNSKQKTIVLMDQGMLISNNRVVYYDCKNYDKITYKL